MVFIILHAERLRDEHDAPDGQPAHVERQNLSRKKPSSTAGSACATELSRRRSWRPDDEKKFFESRRPATGEAPERLQPCIRDRKHLMERSSGARDYRDVTGLGVPLYSGGKGER